jgi:high-affinity iron transporter
VLASFILSVREGLEMALIIGIILGALRKTGRTRQQVFVWAGTITAAVICFIAAVVLQRLGTELEGAAEVIFEGTTMLLAAAVLTWMIFWMHRQARSIKGDIEAGVRRTGGAGGLFFLSFISVFREGIELALFVTAATLTAGAGQSLAGALLGLVAAAILGWSIFASTVQLDLRRFFLITGAVLILFAAGLAARGVHEFTEIGWIPSLVEHLWDTSALLSETSMIGQLARALFGYNSTPTLTELLVYFGYFAAILVGLRRSTSLSFVQKA